MVRMYNKGDGTTLLNPLRRLERLSSIAVYENRALNIRIQQLDPLNKGRTKAHFGKSGIQEGPVDTVKCLLLIQGLNCKRAVRLRGISSNISQKGNVLADIATRDTSGLIQSDNKVQNSQKTPSQSMSTKLVINIQQGDGTPILTTKVVTLFVNKRNETTPLRKRQ